MAVGYTNKEINEGGKEGGKKQRGGEISDGT